MSAADFVLDPRLAADTSPVASLPLCDVRLMNDARYPWLILVPRQAGLVELADLDDADQVALWRELNRAAAALRQAAPCEKLNIAALGIRHHVAHPVHEFRSTDHVVTTPLPERRQAAAFRQPAMLSFPPS